MTYLPFNRKKKMNRKKPKRVTGIPVSFPTNRGKMPITMKRIVPSSQNKEANASKKVLKTQMVQTSPHMIKLDNALERLMGWKKSIAKLSKKVMSASSHHYGPIAEKLLASMSVGSRPSSIIFGTTLENGKNLTKLKNVLVSEDKQLAVWIQSLNEMKRNLSRNISSEDIKQDIDARLQKMSTAWNKLEGRLHRIRMEVQTCLSSLPSYQDQH